MLKMGDSPALADPDQLDTKLGCPLRPQERRWGPRCPTWPNAAPARRGRQTRSKKARWATRPVGRLLAAADVIFRSNPYREACQIFAPH